MVYRFKKMNKWDFITALVWVLDNLALAEATMISISYDGGD